MAMIALSFCILSMSEVARPILTPFCSSWNGLEDMWAPKNVRAHSRILVSVYHNHPAISD